MAKRHHRQTTQTDTSWKGIDAGRGKCAMYFHNPYPSSSALVNYINLVGTDIITTNTNTFEVSSDGITWTTWGSIDSSNTTLSYTLNPDSYLYVRNASDTPCKLGILTGDPSQSTDILRYYRFDVDAELGVLLGGDVRSLLCKNYDNSSWSGWSMEPYTCCKLFAGEGSLQRITLTQWSNGIYWENTRNDVRFDLFPYEEPVANYCYQEMFSGIVLFIPAEPRCNPFGDETDTGLETGALVLPKYHATGCCSHMFAGSDLNFGFFNVDMASYVGIQDTGYVQGVDCCRIITMPPGTVLATQSMIEMFGDCTTMRYSPIDDTIYGFGSGVSNGNPTSNHLAQLCYSNMFRGCTSLVQAPELWHGNPLAISCYRGMFYGCTNLVYPPVLGATTLATMCYHQMFYGCTSLEQAPELPALTLVSNCYREMFYGCSRLKYVVAKFTTTPSSSYTLNWLYGVYNSDNLTNMGGVFVKNPSATWTTDSVTGVPVSSYRWQTITYDGLIFVHRTGSNNWTMNLTSTGSNVNQTVQYSIDGSTWTNYNTGSHPNVSPGNKGIIMWRKNNTNALGNGTSVNVFNINSSNHWCFGKISSMHNGSQNLVNPYTFQSLFEDSGIYTAPKLDITQLTQGCYEAMFKGCTNLVVAPYTPPFAIYSQSDAGSIFDGMFQNCTSLTTIPIIANKSVDWGERSFNSTFMGCQALLNASPIISISSNVVVPGRLSGKCFSNCFDSCSLLSEAPSLHFYDQGSAAMCDMFAAATNLYAAPSIMNDELAPDGLAMLSTMFMGDSNLTTISAYFNTTPSITYTQNWVYGVAANGNFYKSASWNVSGVNGIPSGWTTYQIVRPNIYNPEW